MRQLYFWGLPAWPLLLVAVGVSAVCLLWALRRRLWRWLRAPGRALGWLVGSVLRVRRAHVVQALRVAGVACPEQTAHQMYAALGQNLLELLWAGLNADRPLAELVEVDAAAVERLRSSGHGAVLATAHTGNWDLVACAAAAHLQLVVITKRLSVRWLDRLWQRIRAGRGLRLVHPGAAAQGVARALRQGGMVAALVDQAPVRARATIRCSFLGRSAWVDLTPALLAMRARVPLVVVFARRRSDGVHVAEIRGQFVPPNRPTRAWAEQVMVRTTELLEQFVRQHPEQWLWMHRRWKEPPARPSPLDGAPKLDSSAELG